MSIRVLLVLLFVVGCAGGKKEKKERSKPPVVLIVVDTLRADRLSQYGYRRATSPALRDFARHATLFTRAHAPSPWTTPSTASVYTGLSPARHGSVHKGDALADDLTTLAEVLRERGYQTAGFSANHNISRKTHFNQGFERFDDHRVKRKEIYPDISKTIKGLYAWLKEMDESTPFFLYLHPMNCHGPYLVPKSHRANLLGRAPLKKFRYYGKIMGPLMFYGRVEMRGKVSAAYLKSLNERYDTAVRYTTDRLGELFRRLKSKGLYEQSFIAITADHGEELFDHGGFSHGYTLYEELVRVPLMVKMPHQTHARVSDVPVTLMDIFPTVASLTGEEPAHRLDGRSLLTVLKGGFWGLMNGAPDLRGRDLYFHVDWPARAVGKAMLSGEKKYIEMEKNYELKDANFLFDLRRDPGEKNDLAEDRPRLTRDLKRRMETHWQLLTEQEKGRKTPPNVLSEMDQKVLEELGYIEP